MKFPRSFFILFFILLCYPEFLSAQYYSTDDTLIHPGIKSVAILRCSFTSKGDSSCKKTEESSYDMQGRMISCTMQNINVPDHYDTVHIQYTEKGNEKTKKVLFSSDDYEQTTYSENGLLLREQHVYHGKMESDKNYTYTADEKLATIYNKSSDGTKVLLEKRTYDKSGRLVLRAVFDGTIYGDSIVTSYLPEGNVTRFYARGSRIMYACFTCDSKDSLITEVHYHSAENAIGPNGPYVKPAYVQDSIFYSRDTAENILTSFEMENHPWASSTKLLQYFSYGKYENNLLVSKMEIFEGDTTNFQLWKYDGKRRLIDKQQFYKNKKSFPVSPNDETIYVYNDRGDLIERKVFSRGYSSFAFVYEIQYY